MFYFQSMFMNALNGIDSQNITSGIVQIANTILIVSFLYAAYQSFASGGDVRALGIAGIKYLRPGPRVCELWLDLSRRQQHVQLRRPIDREPRKRHRHVQ